MLGKHASKPMYRMLNHVCVSFSRYVAVDGSEALHATTTTGARLVHLDLNDGSYALCDLIIQT